MVQAQQLRRLMLVGVLLALTFVALTARLWNLQVKEAGRLMAEHENNTKRLIVRQPRRGEILDIRGHPLATSQPVKTVCVDPTLLGPHQMLVARTLGPILGLEIPSLVERLQPKVRQVTARITNIVSDVTNVVTTNYLLTNRYVVLKRKVLLDDWQQVTQAMRKLTFGVVETNLPRSDRQFLGRLREQAVFSEDDQLRMYTGKSSLAHVLGFVGAPDPLHFGEKDFLNPTALTARILGSNDPVSWTIASRFQERSLKSLSDPTLPSKQRLAILRTEFNRLVTGPLLYDARWQGRFVFPNSLREMLSQPLAAGRVPKFNRLLIEEAYTNEVMRSAMKPENAITMEGKYGVEQVMDGFLRGAHGWRRTEQDTRRREIAAFREQDVEPESGRNVVLTIDARIQDIVEAEMSTAVRDHSPAGACAIAVRPATGEILALSVWPTFDPNNPGASPASHLRNRAIADLFEPGSTFKIVVISGALDRGDVTLEEQFHCENGAFQFAGRVLHDAGHRYGVLSVQQILMKSSNIGSAKVGIKMGAESLHDYIRRFGFAERTGIPLEGEVRGILHPLKQWNNLSISRIPMGQEVAVTPLQMVMAMSAIANGGRLMRPMLIARVEDETGRPHHIYEPQTVRQAISPRAARLVTEALKSVISQEGTGKRARLDYYSVAGKTGTAQKSDGRRYLDGKYFASFLGFFPAERPEVCLGVFVDEPSGAAHYGGDVSAPAWKRMAERIAGYLHIAPDLVPDTGPARPGTLAIAGPNGGTGATD
jgi:cell division protein FtsI/penicillin-binding protein 2